MGLKQLLIIRHAKSSWGEIGQKDFDRPLNERGLSDAPMMAKRMLEKKVGIDGFISSTAKRAITTAGNFADVYQFPQKEIQGLTQLYHAYPKDFYQVVSQLKDTIMTAALFSHNPGITEWVNQLSSTHIDNMPTCGIFAIKADILHWNEFQIGLKTFWFFDYPKH